MDCPYCGAAMQHGEIFGDPRRKLSWIPQSRYSQTRMDKILSADMHRLTQVTYKGGSWVEADFCKACKKMIIETDIT